MSAASCLAYFGLKFQIRSDELEAIEQRSDPRIIMSRRVGLDHYFGNFGGSEEKLALFVGTQIALLGPENNIEFVINESELQEIINLTKNKIRETGLSGSPSLHLQWHTDM